MFSGITNFLAPFKMYIYAGLFAVLTAAWFIHGHNKYVEGANDCAQKSAEAQAKYEQDRRKAQAKEADAAIKKASDVAGKIQGINSEREKGINEAEQDAKANSNPGCDLSDDEFLHFNQAIGKANGHE